MDVWWHGSTQGRWARPTGKVAVVAGTRAEIIKLAGVIDGLGAAALVVHVEQVHDTSLCSALFADLGLRLPDHRIATGATRATRISQDTLRLERLFAEERPSAVVIQGDSNAAVAGALAANSLDIRLVHLDAGQRSFDRILPEEHNRYLTDHLADLLCVATGGNAANLAAEGITEGVFTTGDTMVEAVQRRLPGLAAQRVTVANFGCDVDGYVLATIHRPENTDDPTKLAAVLRALAACGAPVIMPLHPRTRAAIERFGLDGLVTPLQVTEPLQPREFLSLAGNAALLISDSGSMQVECTVLKRPLLVVRRSTERPESLDRFAQLVEPDGLLAAARSTLAAAADLRSELARLPSPFGDGHASTRIVKLVRDLIAPPSPCRPVAA